MNRTQRQIVLGLLIAAHAAFDVMLVPVIDFLDPDFDARVMMEFLGLGLGIFLAQVVLLGGARRRAPGRAAAAGALSDGAHLVRLADRRVDQR